MTYVSSLCLTMPWWYVICTGRPCNEHERAFLMVNVGLTIVSMAYRQFKTPRLKQLDQIMIAAIQIIYHVTSNIPLALTFACLSHSRIYYVYIFSTLKYAVEGHWILKSMTLSFGGFCFVRDDEHFLYRWAWHLTQGLMMTYPFLLDEFETKVTLL